MTQEQHRRLIENPAAVLPELIEEKFRNPCYATVLNVAAAYRLANLPEESLATAREAITLQPDRCEGWNQMAQALTDMADWRNAAEAFESAIRRAEVNHRTNTLHFDGLQRIALGYAAAHLRLGKWNNTTWQGWEVGRYQQTWNAIPGSMPWSGQDLKGQHIIVISEGGVGDLILFSRWLPNLKTMGAHVTLAMWRDAVALRDWKSECGVDDILPLPPGDDDYRRPWEYSTSILSLPALLNATPETIPPDTSGVYVAKPIRHVGFCWASAEGKATRKERSLTPAAAQLVADQLQIEGFDVVSLVPKAEDITIPQGVEDATEHMKSWLHTRGWIEQLDAVVTTDSAIAHLAGLLAKPRILLLPKRTDWKWGTEQEVFSWFEAAPTTYVRNPAFSWDPLSCDREWWDQFAAGIRTWKEIV